MNYSETSESQMEKKKKNPGIPFNNLFGKENLNKWWGFLWAARFISHFP